MVGINFDRPVGPYADTKELEYISSLHQTCYPLLRKDGSVEAIDILYYLKSRHGIQIEEDMVRKAIIMELCGSPELKPLEKKDGEEFSSELDLKKETAKDGEEEEEEEEKDPEPVMDICQMLALLLIPFLRSGNSDGTDQEAVSRTIQIALDTIWAELRTHAVDVQGSDTDEGVLITPELLGEILDVFGEFNVDEAVLKEMVEAASGDDNQDSDKPQFYLTKASFLQALTHDTQLYDPNHDENLNTHFNEARLIGMKAIEDEKKMSDEDEVGKQQEPPFKVVYMADNVDNTADNYRSTLWFALAWVTAVFVYLCYMSNTDIKATPEEFEKWGCDKLFGCDLARALYNWTLIFVELMLMGLIWVFVTTLGNSSHPTETIAQKAYNTLRISLGMTLTIFGTILPFWYGVDLEVVDTQNPFNSEEGGTVGEVFYVAAYYICLILGFVMVFCQLMRLLSIYTDLGPLTKGSQEFKERRTKRAATAKITRLVEHATLLHVSPDDERKSFASANSLKKSTVSMSVQELARKLHEVRQTPRSKSMRDTGGGASQVLRNFSLAEDVKEPTGGVSWTYKRIFDGSLFSEEGVYLHGRLLAVNISQFMVLGILLGMFAMIYQLLDIFLGRKDDGCDFRIPGLIVDEGGTNSTFEEAEDAFFRHLQEAGGSNIFNNQTEGEEAGLVDNFFDQFENQTLEDIFNNETISKAIHFIEGLANLVQYDAGELRGYKNWTISDWNINDTHFFDGFHLFEGQFPNWTAEYSDYDGQYPVICYDFYASNFTYVWFNGNSAFNEFLKEAKIEDWQYRLAASIGLIFAILAASTIAFVYIPSFVSSMLKLRSGYDPSLKGNLLQFLNYRKSPDQCSILYGSAFWGVLSSSGLAFLIFGTLTFVIAWPITRPYIKTLIANLMGIGTTISIKVLIMMCARKSLFAGGFYRKKPAVAAITNVVLEAWSLGTSIGTVMSRAVKLICITVFFIGRIDTPMLAEGIGFVRGTPMDPAPFAFRKDLLIHEAHRHPYIERLGLMYLLKLHGGKCFGTRAGAHWRLLFTLALLPWMRKYRVSRGTPVSGKDDIEDVLDAIEGADNPPQEQEAVTPEEAIVPKEANVASFAWDENDSIENLAAKRRELKNQLKALNEVLSEKLKDPREAAASALDRSRLMESQRLERSSQRMQQQDTSESYHSSAEA